MKKLGDETENRNPKTETEAETETDRERARETVTHRGHRKSSIHTHEHYSRGELWNGGIPNFDITGSERQTTEQHSNFHFYISKFMFIFSHTKKNTKK